MTVRRTMIERADASIKTIDAIKELFEDKCNDGHSRELSTFLKVMGKYRTGLDKARTKLLIEEVNGK